LAIDLTNPELPLTSGTTVPSGTFHIYRTKFLAEAGCVEMISARNFGNVAVDLDFTIAFAADFSDIFEVRGQTRPRRCTALASEIESRGVTLNYSGLDNLNISIASFRYRTVRCVYRTSQG
jgi:glycogen debranching enzyme